MARRLANLLRRLRNQVPFLVVFAIVVAVLVYLTVAPGHWRRGTATIALAMLVGALLRFGLPDRQAGFLRVRGKSRSQRWRQIFHALKRHHSLRSVAAVFGR